MTDPLYRALAWAGTTASMVLLYASLVGRGAAFGGAPTWTAWLLALALLAAVAVVAFMARHDKQVSA